MSGLDASVTPTTIIEIESDPEEDQRIINEYRQSLIVSNRRQNRPRDISNRFINSQTLNRQQNEVQEGLIHTDDDDLQIVNEMYLNDEGPIDGTPEFIDLEYNQPQSRTVFNYSEDNDNDDEVAILEERTTVPTFLLNLPSGQTLRIRGTIQDINARRSFENQRTARGNILRRVASSAQRLFITDPEDSINGDEIQHENAYLPQNVVRERQRNQLQDHIFRQTIPEVDVLDSELRSMFYHAETPHELRNMMLVNGIDVNTASSTQLLQLFVRFRSRQINNWARERTQDFQSRTSGRLSGHNGVQGSIFNSSRRHRHPFNGRQSTPFTSFVLGRSIGGFSSWPRELFGENEDEVTQNIIDMIQEREEQDLDNRKMKYMEDKKSQQQSFIDRAAQLPDKYSSSFDFTPKMKITMERNGQSEEVLTIHDESAKDYIDISVCCLCGVELGLGIPDDFQGILQVNKEVPFESLISKYDFSCPYQALERPSAVDRELSKKTFVAHCGHTFCGRCFARINNAKKFSKVSKKKLAELHGPLHPDNYGPRICPATGCKGQLRARGRMREVFF